MLNVFSFRSGESMLASVAYVGIRPVKLGHEINSSRVMSL